VGCRDWLNRTIYREVRAQTAPIKLHLVVIEAHLADLEATLTALDERTDGKENRR
jgi:hypothetical protein